MAISLDGWNIVQADKSDWLPWTGSAGEARAKILGTADGYTVVLVEAQPGYRGTPHTHAYAEFHYLIDGTVTNQGEDMQAGDGYAAAAGSTHDDFATDTARRTSPSSRSDGREVTCPTAGHSVRSRWVDCSGEFVAVSLVDSPSTRTVMVHDQRPDPDPGGPGGVRRRHPGALHRLTDGGSGRRRDTIRREPIHCVRLGG